MFEGKCITGERGIEEKTRDNERCQDDIGLDFNDKTCAFTLLQLYITINCWQFLNAFLFTLVNLSVHDVRSSIACLIL